MKNRKEIRKALADYKTAIRKRDTKATKQAGIKLVQVMIKGVAEFKDINPEEVFHSPVHFIRLVRLAEKV